MLTLVKQDPLHKYNFFKDNIYFTSTAAEPTRNATRKQKSLRLDTTTKRAQLPISHFFRRQATSGYQVSLQREVP